jgi:hypothetical protein
MVHLDFKATNNMAEYEALIFRLSTALSLLVWQLLVKGNSQLIINQVKGDCSCNDPQLAAYLLHVQKLEKYFQVLDLHHVSRANNVVTDDLSIKASTWASVPDGVFERRLLRPIARPAKLGEWGETSTSKLAVPVTLFPWSLPRVVGITGDSVHPNVQDLDAQLGTDTWITEIRGYLKDNILPDEHASTEQIIRMAKWYTLVEGDLYWRGANGILLRCISQEEGCKLLIEIHRGECDIHASSCTLVSKAFWYGFYWPITLQESIELVKRYRACHFHAKQIYTPAQMLQMIPPSWLFIVWGMNILGPFPRAVGGYPYLYVAIDKFTKWPKATPVVKIKKQSVVKFIKLIIWRVGVPNRIITDNGTQFTSRVFLEYYEDLSIQICYASIVHPESNGQVERANAKIPRCLNTCTYDCLKKHGAKWIDELSCVMWANWTSPSRATGETPFFLVYGAETVLPPEITMGSTCVQAYDEAT